MQPITINVLWGLKRPQKTVVRLRWLVHVLMCFPDQSEVGILPTLHHASNTLHYAYIALPFGMLLVHFLVIWALEHHFPKLEGGRSMVLSITLPEGCALDANRSPFQV